MGKVLSLVSVKGGTGKTTTTVNTGLTLAREGFRVLILDANLEGSNMAFHLGVNIHDVTTIHDVLRGESDALDAIYTHPSGLNLMMGGVSLEDMELRDHNINKIIRKVKEQFDYVIIDCSSGLSGSVKSAIKKSDEIVIVTNPELPAVVDAHKIIKFCDKNESFIKGVVINKLDKRSDLSSSDVEAILGRPVIGSVMDDNQVKTAMSKRLPIVNYKPRRKSAKQFKNVAYTIADLSRREPITIWDRILSKF